jgi:hypothetical protein
MTVVPFQGPLVIYKSNPSGSSGPAGSANQNPQEGPSPINQGMGLLDPRFPFTYYPGQDNRRPVFMFMGGGDYITVNAVPSTLAANNIAASQSPGAGAIVLVSSSGAGITINTTITRADTGAAVTGLLAIDGAMTPLGFGQDGTVSLWDPSKAISRAIRYVSGGNDTGITFTCNGYDLYGYPISETTTGANAATATGTKAFKYISTITHTGSVAGTLTIGTTDVFGLPLRSDVWGDTSIVWNNAWVTANNGYVAAVTTNPATAITGDVRGTYLVQGATSNGTLRLIVYASPLAGNVSTVNGLFGVPQFTSLNNGT